MMETGGRTPFGRTHRAVLLCALVMTGACTHAGGARPGVPSRNVTAVQVDVSMLVAANDSAGIARAIQTGCRKSIARSSCFHAQLVPLAEAGHVKLAMATLGQIAKADENIRRTGHEYAHAIGIAAGKLKGDVAATFTQCSESFQSGCYHGVIQAWFAGLDSIGAKETESLCAPFRTDESLRWIRFQCVHGMGHGLTMLYGHDLPKGLAGCDLLSDWWDRHSCYSGAFMENIVNVTNPHHPASALAHGSKAGGGGDDMADMADMADMEGMEHEHTAKFKAVDPADQLYPCSALNEKYVSACYEMQTSVMLYNNKGDIAGAARACDTAPQAMRVICYSSLGRDVSSYSGQRHDEAIRMCSLGTPLYQPWCYFGLVKNIIDLNARPEEGMSLCRSVPDISGKVVCYTAVGEEIWLLAKDETKRRSMCSTADEAFLDACLFGSRVVSVVPPALAAVWKSVRP